MKFSTATLLLSVAVAASFATHASAAAALKNYAKSNEPSEIPKLKAAYGYVNIYALSMPQPRAIVDISPGHNLSEEERAVLNRAARSVASPGKFHGYMPAGKYKLGSKEFVVTPGATIEINVP